MTAGGALMQTTDVENFPGFPDGIMGPELMDSLRKQAERFGAELVSDDVVEVDLTASPKVVKTETDTYLAKAVIIATGSKYKELGIPGEKLLSGHGVSWCATCDGFFFREQDIAVVGGGDSALEEALFLTRFGKSVTLVHRRDKLRASKIMQERAFANPKIKFQWDSDVVSMEGDGKVSGLRVRNVHTGEETVLPVGGVFIAIGHLPRSELFAGQLAHQPRRLPGGRGPVHPDRDRRRLRLRRRGRPRLPAGDHRGGHRLLRRDRRGAVAGGARARSTHNQTDPTGKV